MFTLVKMGVLSKGCSMGVIQQYRTVEKKAFCVLAGLAELGNVTPASHFQLVSMAWPACSLAVMAMAFLCSLLLRSLERKKLLQVFTGVGGWGGWGRWGGSQRVLETSLSHVGL